MSDKKRLVCVIMGQNCERFIEMCLESVKDADAIVYCDGGSSDNTLNIVTKFFVERSLGSKKSIPDTIINNEYNQEDLGMNGKQRNFYLNHLKKNYPNDWTLCLDADEVVEDLSKIKEFIQNNGGDVDIGNGGLWSVKMRHLVSDLAHEDALQETHYVLNRLFKISEAGEYPEVEHPVLQPKVHTVPEGQEIPQVAIGRTDCTTIWHLAYIPNMWEIKKRYDNHLKKSNMHTPQFLKQWYHAHLFGKYPKREFNPVELPSVILNKFGINKDELYFQDRGIDMKHPLMVKQWYDYFKPDSVLDLGCGKGPYLYFWNWFIDDIQGIELSEFAVQNSFIPNKISQGDITEPNQYDSSDGEDWDLITAIDVLEHLDDKQLSEAMNNIVNYGKKFLFSVPVIGDPNLENDKTHKQFRTKEDWIKLWESYGIKIKETPTNWLFAHQLFIGEKNDN